jgi:hypothetical protein
VQAFGGDADVFSGEGHAGYAKGMYVEMINMLNGWG